MKPMAYFFIDRSNERPHKAAFPALRFHPPDPARHPGPVTPLYPAREWVGLTTEEQEALGRAFMAAGQSVHELIGAIQKTLEQKNSVITNESE